MPLRKAPLPTGCHGGFSRHAGAPFVKRNPAMLSRVRRETLCVPASPRRYYAKAGRRNVGQIGVDLGAS
jgi:hypothetical protein